LICRLSESSSSEDVEQTAAVMAVGLHNVVQSARSVAVKSSTVTDSHSSFVALPVFSLVEDPKRSEYDVIDEEEAYLSPEERIERRKQHGMKKAEDHYKVSNQVFSA